MTHFNVLVFPGGTEIGLEINRALRDCKEITLFSAGIPDSNHAPLVFLHHFDLPSIHQVGWLDALRRIVTQHKIDFIFPAHDDIIVALVSREQEIGAKVVTSPLETCLITRSKLRSYQFFASILPTPHVYKHIEDIDTFPVFTKPDIGQGSQGALKVETREQLESLLDESIRTGREIVIMEYLPGAEYTIDCFSHRTQGLLFCEGRERIRTKNGISMACRHIADPVFTDYAQRISENLGLHGAWFFQLKRDTEGMLKLLEVAPRIAGTMALSRVKGINFPLMSIYEALNQPLNVLTNELNIEIDRALINRYRHSLQYDVIYIDLDDTIILNQTLNLDALRLIHQCINKGVRVVLLTRHEGPLTATLRRFRLSELFDEIFHVQPGQTKASFINEPRAIFVDDSFHERKLVQERCGIPTFDNSMIEMLFDDKA